MTSEEKQLLLKDLCARLPYGVNVEIKGTYDDGERYTRISELDFTMLGYMYDDESSIIPYLRPMSSMTEEELKMFKQLQVEADEAGTFEGDMLLYDWLNKNHFDYRLLIFQGLALEASEGMYKTK